MAGLRSTFDLPESAVESARRAALARWLTDPANPLTWRSIVNRVWQHHFGRGLVDTPNDFGRMGSAPTHPELLDWLAVEFRDSGGSLKDLHRLIVTSAGLPAVDPRTIPDGPPAVDADNRLLWRQNRRRLDAESVRDAILLAAGRLDRTMGGPSVQQFGLSKPGVHVIARSSTMRRLRLGRPLGAGRRGCLPVPFPHPARPVHGRARRGRRLAVDARAERVGHVAPGARSAQQPVRPPPRPGTSPRPASTPTAPATSTHPASMPPSQLTLGRPPTADELRDWSTYADRHGLANACRLLFNSNEFLFLN